MHHFPCRKTLFLVLLLVGKTAIIPTQEWLDTVLSFLRAPVLSKLVNADHFGTLGEFGSDVQASKYFFYIYLHGVVASLQILVTLYRHNESI